MSPPPSAKSQSGVVSAGSLAHTLRVASGDEVPQLARTLADAFGEDPVCRWLLPPGPRFRARLRIMFTAELQLYVLRNGGTVWTTSAYDGALCVLAPGSWQMPASFELTEALRWARAFGMRLARAGRVQQELQERHPQAPHFYVRWVGARVARQGQGLGTALLQAVLDEADLAGLPAYIEASSERSAALYERLGFEHTGALTLPGGGPMVWPMLRPVVAR